MAGTISFDDFVATRPSTSSIGSNDTVIILQDGMTKVISPGNAGFGTPEASTVLINASTTPTTTLPESGTITYIKIDDSVDIAGFAVSIVGQTMCQELINGLSVQYEPLTVKLIGTHWYRR